MADVISNAHEIALKISNSTDMIDETNAAFDEIHGILQLNASDLATTTLPDITTIAPTIDDIICRLSGGCGRDQTTPTLLDPEAAMAEIQGWASGSLPQPSLQDDIVLPPDAVNNWNGAISDMVKIWKNASENPSSQKQKRAMGGEISADKIERREPISIIILAMAFLWKVMHER